MSELLISMQCKWMGTGDVIFDIVLKNVLWNMTIVLYYKLLKPYNSFTWEKTKQKNNYIYFQFSFLFVCNWIWCIKMHCKIWEYIYILQRTKIYIFFLWYNVCWWIMHNKAGNKGEYGGEKKKRKMEKNLKKIL